MAGGRTYRLRIVRADKQFEAEGDKAFVLQMLRRFEGESVAMPGPPVREKQLKVGKVADSPRLASAKGLSVGEFIRQFRFRKHTDFVLAFGYYLEKHSGLADFTPADVNNCYYEAKMEASNTSQMIVQNIRRGFMMQARNLKSTKGTKRRYTLTQSGEDYLKKAIAKAAEQ